MCAAGNFYNKKQRIFWFSPQIFYHDFLCYFLITYCYASFKKIITCYFKYYSEYNLN